MNIYFVDAGDVAFYGGEWEPPETGRAVGMIRADSRSQAQYVFWRSQLQQEGSLHEFNYKTRLVAKDVSGFDSEDISFKAESEGWWRLLDERDRHHKEEAR
jgi:hypothetical protein